MEKHSTVHLILIGTGLRGDNQCLDTFIHGMMGMHGMTNVQGTNAGMKITAGHRPKSVHIARLAVHFTLRSDITAGREMHMRLQ